MKTLTKVTIKTFLISGLIYAGIIAVVDYLRGREFDVWKFVLGFLFLGVGVSLVERYKYKNRGNTK